MSFVGVDLHKQVIQICVIRLEGSQRRVVCSRRLACRDVAAILTFFQGLGPFRVVVEATASYEWFVKLIEPLRKPINAQATPRTVAGLWAATEVPPANRFA